MSNAPTHDKFCPWVDYGLPARDHWRFPPDNCSWCHQLALARADATQVADQMLVQATWLADEAQQALKAAIDIILDLRNDVGRIADDLQIRKKQ
jgi:hypothetical protein